MELKAQSPRGGRATIRVVVPLWWCLFTGLGSLQAHVAQDEKQQSVDDHAEGPSPSAAARNRGTPPLRKGLIIIQGGAISTPKV